MPAPVDFWTRVLAHRGKRIAVMGGAPSLAEHLATGVEADVWISANHHGLVLRSADYVLCMDEVINDMGGKSLPDHIRSLSDAKIISPYPSADIQLVSWPQYPRLVNSGMIATWAAFMMGAKVVMLFGFDAYGGTPGVIDEAHKMARDVNCPVRVVGDGPLTKVWPQYRPEEAFGRYTPHSSINAWLNIDEKVTVECIKPVAVRGIEMKRGERLNVMRFEVARQLKHRMLKEV
jgi:hypothetical protein